MRHIPTKELENLMRDEGRRTKTGRSRRGQLFRLLLLPQRDSAGNEETVNGVELRRLMMKETEGGACVPADRPSGSVLCWQRWHSTSQKMMW